MSIRRDMEFVFAKEGWEKRIDIIVPEPLDSLHFWCSALTNSLCGID
jgi:hypothetical protein